ncbi:MAG: hypothetical protein WBN02_15925 [Sedimenticolaceae bacterium]|jgi:hypothetical protein
MIHVLLRIAVWVVVFGIGYLLIGPQLFDSSHRANPFESSKQLYLPPVKSQRLIEYENLLEKRSLEGVEIEEYRALVRERQSNFWKAEGISVEDALAGVKKQRKEHLAALLIERGISDEEAAIFFTVAERDHSALFDDRE